MAPLPICAGPMLNEPAITVMTLPRFIRDVID
jgi:hypothetical protein